MVHVGGVSNKCREFRGGCLGFICSTTGGHTVHVIICEWCPLQLRNAVAQLPVHHSFFRKFSSPVDILWPKPEQSEQEDKEETQGQPILARDGLFYFNSPVCRAVRFLPGVAAFVPCAFQKIPLLLLAEMDFCCSQRKDCECYGHEPVKITHAGHQSKGRRSRVQEWGVSVPVRVWSGRVPLDTFYPCFMLLRIVLRWRSANGLTLEADRTDFRTQLSYLLAECPSYKSISALARGKRECLSCRAWGDQRTVRKLTGPQ